MPTEQEVNELADAMWHLLDDMGKNGLGVCLCAKVQAVIAYEPFKTPLERAAYDGMMTLAEALEVDKQC